MDSPDGGAPPAPDAAFRPEKLRRFLPAAGFALLSGVLVLPGAGAAFTLAGSDMFAGSFGIRGLVGRILRDGRLPIWDPHTMGGFPLMAAMQAGVLYPLTWPAAFLSPGPFWTLTVLLHLILAGLFAFGWLRHGLKVGPGAAFVGACVFMLSGYLLTRVLGGHISQVSSYPWIAAVLWRTERMLAAPTLRRGLLLAGSATLLILPGFPQYVFFLALIGGIRVAAFRIRAGNPGTKPVLLTLASGLAGGLLAAPQLMATLEMLPEVQRVSGRSFEFATQLSVPPHNLLCLIAPSFFGNDGAAPYWSRGAIWEATGFIGIGGLLLAALALRGSHPQRWFWAAAAFVSVLVALGSEAPFFTVFYHAVPGASLFRQPGRYFTVFTIAGAALAALGFDRLWNDDPGVRRAARAVGVAAAAGLVALLAGAASLGKSDAPDGWHRFVASQLADRESLVSPSVRKDADFPEKAKQHARGTLFAAALTTGLLAAALIAVAFGRLRARPGAAVLGSILVLELILFGRSFFKPQDPAGFTWPAEFTEFVRHVPGGPFRLASPGPSGFPHIGKCELAGIDHIAGYESMVLRRYCELMNVLHGRPPETVRMVSSVNVPHPVLDMLGVRFWLLPDGSPVPPGWRAIGKVTDAGGESLVLESPQAFPRAFIVHEAVSIPSRDERLRALKDGAVDLRKRVVLETSGNPLPPSREPGPSSAALRAPAEGRYEVATESDTDGYLVLAETAFPGWEATIDGVATEVLNANHMVQAIRLPAGRHSVHFVYRSRGLRRGALVSAVAALAMLGLWGASLRRRPRA